MTSSPRLVLGSLAAAVAYTCAYYFDWALFRYFPQDGHVEWLRPAPPHVATISWYGWILTALLAGSAVTLLTPRRWTDRLNADAVWLIPLLLILATLLYEKRWLLPLP